MHRIENAFQSVTAIPHEDLGDVIFETLGPKALMFDQVVAQILATQSPDYTGGMWTGYVSDTNDVFFMVPPAGQYQLDVPGNGYSGTVDAETAGIIVSLVALNNLVWQTRDPEHNAQFYNLRQFALEHPNQPDIFAAID